VGEYVGRIYQQVRARPRYVVQTVLQGMPDAGLDAEAVEKRQVVR
jgi:undecaprenyl-phosphate 4-deoxy-4-formamido-L-arabinose transferase